MQELFKFSAIILFIIVRFYWFIAEKATPHNRRGHTAKKLHHHFHFIIPYLLGSITLYQFFIENIFFPIQDGLLPIIGILLMVLGALLAVYARHELAHHWNHAAHAQIKNDHELVQTGVYRYVRHPIYMGFWLLYVGSQMIASSWLFLIFGTLAFIGIYIQSKREESLLERHFGQAYKQYRQQTWMFIPKIL